MTCIKAQCTEEEAPDCKEKACYIKAKTGKEKAMNIHKAMREKYKGWPKGPYPYGEELLSLCDTIDKLVCLIREIQPDLPTDTENEVDRKLGDLGF